MSTILLSIKPEYSKRIFNGTKKYEFRKHIAKKKIDRIIVYSSSPDQMVLGEVSVIGTISMKPSPLWELTKKDAGISRAKFRKYFHGCREAHAYKLGNLIKYDVPKELSDFGLIQAPQSFVYINDSITGTTG